MYNLLEKESLIDLESALATQQSVMHELPEYCSLQNVSNEEYRCNHATKLRDEYTNPDCLFKLTKQSDGSYAIQNMANEEYFQNTITKMSKTATTKKQWWKIVRVEGENTYTIQNVSNEEYMTSHASKLSSKAGENEKWIIESRTETSSWMGQHWDLLASRPLSKICMPGSHDSGTFKQTSITKFAAKGNTKTQQLSIKEQLEQGVRVFDLRPVFDKGGFYTMHCSEIDVLKFGYQGAFGVLLKEAFQDIKAFFANPKSKKELAVLNFSHFMDWPDRDNNPNMKPKQKQDFLDLLEKELGSMLIRSTTKGLNLCGKNLNELIAMGNVVALFQEDFDENGAKGIWTSSNFPTQGSYSNTNSLKKMISGDENSQLEKLKDNARKKGENPFMFELCWQLTQSDEQATYCTMKKWGVGPIFVPSTTILDLAAKANKALYPTVQEWINKGIITKEVYPNIINTDDCNEHDTGAVELCIEICHLLA